MGLWHQGTNPPKPNYKDLLWHFFFLLDEESKEKYPTAIYQDCGKSIRQFKNSYKGMLL
jgi:hypothetical protein